MSKAPFSPAIPPCSIAGTAIRGLYAGRFIALPWRDWELLAVTAFPEDGKARLERIVRCATSPCGSEEVARALVDYRSLVQRAPGLLAEEVRHHADLVRTPIWGVQNAAGFLERLHLVEAQRLYGKPRAEPRLRRNLGHALRLHLLRRYLDRQDFAVIETISLLPELAQSPKPWRVINDFELGYGLEAGALATAIWDRITHRRDVQEAVDSYQRALLSCLDTRLLEEEWLDLMERGFGLLAPELQSSRLAQHFLRTIDGAGSSELSRGVPIPWLLVRYFARVGGGGLSLGLLVRSGLSLTGSLRLAVTHLLRRDPYAIEGGREGLASLPALRTYRPGTGGIIVDPAVVARGAARLNNPGFENLLSIPSPGYATDQFLLRKLVERHWDAEGAWSNRLMKFIRRWMGAGDRDWRRVEAALEVVAPLIEQMAERAQMEEVRDELCRGYLAQELLNPHIEARRLLLECLGAERLTGSQPVIEMLHAYYMHGL